MSLMTNDQQARYEKAKRYLRLFMRDTAELNRLIRKEESDPEMFEFAIEMAISDWNTTPPLSGGKKNILTYPSLYLLMHGAAIQLLKSNGILQARNELNYSAGGSSFMRSNKSNYYLAWMTNFMNEYNQKMLNSKITSNIAAGWGGGASSEYDRIGYAW